MSKVTTEQKTNFNFYDVELRTCINNFIMTELKEYLESIEVRSELYASKIEDIFMLALSRIWLLHQFKLTSRQVGIIVAREIQKIDNDPNVSNQHDGTNMLKLKISLERKTGACHVNPLLVYQEPNAFYNVYCKSTAPRKHLCMELINFIVQETQLYPTIHSATLDIQAVYFCDFFSKCETFIKTKCQRQTPAMIYHSTLSEDNRISFIKKVMQEHIDLDPANNHYVFSYHAIMKYW